MTVCDGDRQRPHEEIVYEGTECPLCTANDKISDAKKENETLQSKIEDLESELEDLESS